MALPVYPNAISLGQVNTELGISPSTTLISLNQAAVRALFVRPSVASSYSVSFNGSTQYLKLPSNSSAWTLNGDFTIECWFNTTTTGQNGIFTMNWSGDWNAVYGNGFSLSSNVVVTPQGNTTWTSPSINVWHHIAVVRSGATMTTYLDGVNVGSQTNSNIFGNASTTPGVGLFDTQSGIRCPFPGYISNLRILKGTALYTAAFTPSISPLTSITNTSLLTCNAATIADSSNNNFTITNNNTATVSSTITPFSGGAIAMSDGHGKSFSTKPYGTGGNTYNSGGYRYHWFTQSGTINFTVAGILEILVIGAGGGGGCDWGGGGGGGGINNQTISVSTGNTSITVGSQGIGAVSAYVQGGDGGTSYFGAYAGNGGGGGGYYAAGAGRTGGCGGGGGGPSGGVGGGGNQGYSGGDGLYGVCSGGGGGMGGAGLAGNNGHPIYGKGGPGQIYNNFQTIFGPNVRLSPGGGGGGQAGNGSGVGGLGGDGGGGQGGGGTNPYPNAGTNGSQSGAGGGGGGDYGGLGGDGHQGLVVVRYLYP